MNQSFYTAAVGAQQQQQRLNIQGNNIANVNNYGFKAKKATFSTLMYNGINGVDNNRLPVGVGTQITQAPTDTISGSYATTGRTLDYAIEGDGFFAVVNTVTGQVSYTRDGAFVLSEFQEPTGEVDETGEPILETVYRLADAQGRMVLNDEGNYINVTDQERALPIGVFDFINYDGMQHIGTNQFLPVDKNGQIRFGTGQLRQGVLEASNVDLADEITKVIESQRAYSMALKMVLTSDEIETTINGLRS